MAEMRHIAVDNRTIVVTLNSLPLGIAGDWSPSGMGMEAK